MPLQAEKIDQLPSAMRGGARDEETAQLEEWVASKEPYLLTGVDDEEYTKIQQRIRSAANRVGISVKVHRQPDNKVAFQGYDKEDTITKADRQRKSKGDDSSE